MPVSAASSESASNEWASPSKGLVYGVCDDELGRAENSEAGVEDKDRLELDQGEGYVPVDEPGDESFL